MGDLLILRIYEIWSEKSEVVGEVYHTFQISFIFIFYVTPCLEELFYSCIALKLEVWKIGNNQS